MRSIWKYELKDKVNKILVPADAIVLTVAGQAGHSCIWFSIPDVEASKEERTFILRATGEEYADSWSEEVFIGTVFLNNRMFVFHVFENFRSNVWKS